MRSPIKKRRAALADGPEAHLEVLNASDSATNAADFQARTLRQRFTMEPELARALASLCWGGAA